MHALRTGYARKSGEPLGFRPKEGTCASTGEHRRDKLDQGAQCVEREVFALCFARRPSCAEWMVVGRVGMTTSW